MSINLGFIEIIFLFGDLILKKKSCMSIEKRIIIYLFIIFCIILILFFMLNWIIFYFIRCKAFRYSSSFLLWRTKICL